MSADKMTTTDGRPVDEVRAEQERDGNKMHTSYIVLTEEECAKGFVRPVRRSYKHVGPPRPASLRDLTDDEKERYKQFGYVKFEPYPPERSPVTGMFWTQARLDAVGGCGAVTTMGIALAETYARDPNFYGATMCAACGKHFPVGATGEFVWMIGGGCGSLVETTERVGT